MYLGSLHDILSQGKDIDSSKIPRMPLQMTPPSPSEPIANRDNPMAPSIQSSSYPLPIKSTKGTISSIPTTLTIHSFTDKILLTILQTDRLAQWVQVPLSPPNYSNLPLSAAADADGDGDDNGADDDSLLPMAHLTPRTLLGGGSPEREVLGQLIASLIGSAILRRNGEERRMVVVGLGLRRWEMEREGFFDLVELVGREM